MGPQANLKIFNLHFLSYLINIETGMGNMGIGGDVRVVERGGGYDYMIWGGVKVVKDHSHPE